MTSAPPAAVAPTRRDRRLVLAVAAVTVCIGLLLAVQLPLDPNIEMTGSDSPFTDEGWSVLGARNAVLLGRWITDEWQLVIAQLPFNAAAYVSFRLFGVGIIQARLVSLLATLVAVAVLGLVVGRRHGVTAGVLAALALGSAPLVLFYGRLALLEATVMAALVVALALLIAPGGRTWLPGGLAGVAMAVALGTKPSAAAPIAGMLAGGLVAGGTLRPLLGRRTAVAVALVAVAGVAWAVGVTAAGISIPAALRPWPETNAIAPLTVLAERAWTYLAGGNDQAAVRNAPLLIGAALGGIVIWRRRGRLDPQQRILVGAAVGWVVVGLLVLLVVTYRPNRYTVPLLPPLAILTAVGGSLLLGSVARTGARRILAAAIVVAVVASGAGHLLRWQAIATYRLPQIQEEMVRLLPPGAVVHGWFASTFAMRAPVVTIIAQGEVNRGDTYERYGVRWLLIERRGEPVDWITEHRDAWARRESFGCWAWQRGITCLDRLP